MASLSIPYSDFVPATSIVSQQFDDNNAAIVNYINARNSGSTAWDAVKSTGTYLGGDGTVSLPEFSFTNDPDCGLYRIGTNDIALATAGTIALEITSAQKVNIGAGTKLGADLSISRATSGNWVYVECANTSNTSSSHSQILSTVAGSSAGDSYFTSQIDSSTQWSFGLDNSDSDAFCLTNAGTLNGTNLFKITTAGQVQLGNGTGATNVQINSATASGANTATMTNSPTTGNPAVWIVVNINGTDRKIPAWA